MKNLMAIILLGIASLMPAALYAQNMSPVSAEAISIEPRYLARITLNTPTELEDALLRAKALANEEQPSHPIAFILHGQEVYSLLSEQREQHLKVFSLAEELSQKNVISIKVCSAWLDWQRINKGQLPSFVKTIEYGPTEIHRLIHKEGYTYF